MTHQTAATDQPAKDQAPHFGKQPASQRLCMRFAVCGLLSTKEVQRASLKQQEADAQTAATLLLHSQWPELLDFSVRTLLLRGFRSAAFLLTGPRASFQVLRMRLLLARHFFASRPLFATLPRLHGQSETTHSRGRSLQGSQLFLQGAARRTNASFCYLQPSVWFGGTVRPGT